jgi:hypothetical protein
MILFDKKFGYLKSRRIFEASQREIIITTKQNTKIMKNFATLATELNQANKYFAKFVKKGDDKTALMWAIRIK